MAEITHACIYNLESEDFDVVKLSDFVRLPKPKTYKDFEVYNAYTIKTGKTFEDVEIVAVGDLHEMEAATNIVAEAKITHAVVGFQADFEFKVIEICMIKEYQRFVPEYKTRFSLLRKYHAKRKKHLKTSIFMHLESVGFPYRSQNNKSCHSSQSCFYFADENEMCVMRESLLKAPTHGIIRYIENNAINILDIKDIQKGLWDFRHSEDFDQYAVYKTESSSEIDKIAKDIQVLAVGQLCDCNERLQSLMHISHVLVRQIKIDKCIIVDIKPIEEFAKNPPESETDFIPQKPYVFLDKGNHKKSAVEVYSMGSKEKIVFECLHSSKRFAKKKFTLSDIELAEDLAHKKILSPNSTKRKATGRPGKSVKSLTNRKSLDKKQTILNTRNRILRIDSSSSSGSDDESITAKLARDLNNNNGDDKINDEDENVDALNQRILDGSTVPSPMHSPTGSGKSARRSLFNDHGMNSPDRTTNRDRFSRQQNARQRRQKPTLSNRNHYRPGMHKRPAQKRKFSAKSSFEQNCKVPRIRKSDQEEFYQAYWSDSSIGERDYGVFEEWTEYDSENESVTQFFECPLLCIHVGWNHSIPTKSWRSITKSKNASLFTKKMSRCLWKEEIINKCIENKEYYMKTVTDKPRSEVTPSKMKAIHQCLKYWVLVYHADWLYTETIDDILRKLEHYLGEEIAYQIKEYEKARNPNKEKKKKKTWRDC